MRCPRPSTSGPLTPAESRTLAISVARAELQCELSEALGMPLEIRFRRPDR